MKPSFKKLRFLILLFLALSLTFIAIAGPALAPQNPNTIDLEKSYTLPGREHILGTDRLGRDIFSRLLVGARNSFALTVAMVLIVACIGSAIGMFSGFVGGAVDSVIMQVADTLLAFPSMVFVIAIVGIWGSGIYRTVLTLGVVCWAKYARLAQGLVTEIRRSEYVTVARFGGSRWYRILGKYVMPNILPPIVIAATLDIGEMMITLSALSFLGLVGQPPTPEWGNMLANSRALVTVVPHLVLYPALAILITVVVFNLLGDSLRDILDPRETK